MAYKTGSEFGFKTGALEYYMSIKDNELLRLLSEGRSHKEIGQIVNLSHRTIDAKVLEMQHHFLAKNTAHLVSISYQNGNLKVKNI